MNVRELINRLEENTAPDRKAQVGGLLWVAEKLAGTDAGKIKACRSSLGVDEEDTRKAAWAMRKALAKAGLLK